MEFHRQLESGALCCKALRKRFYYSACLLVKHSKEHRRKRFAPIAPGAAQEITLPLKQLPLKPGAKYFLKVTFALAADLPWAQQGHVVAWERVARGGFGCARSARKEIGHSRVHLLRFAARREMAAIAFERQDLCMEQARKL